MQKTDRTSLEKELRFWSWNMVIMFVIFNAGMMIGGSADAAINRLNGTSGDSITGIGSIAGYLIGLLVVIGRVRGSDSDWKSIMPFHIGIRFGTVWKSILLALAIQPTASAIYYVSDMFLPGSQIVESVQNSVPMMLYVAVVGPLFEEFIYRGMAYGSFRKTGKIRLSMLLSAVMFGMMHGAPSQIIYAAVLGLVLAVIREKTGSM